MFPQMQSVLLNWTESTPMKVILKTPVNFESVETVIGTPTVEMMLTVMKPRDIQRKPENERIWKWWNGICTTRFNVDDILEDPAGLQYRIQTSSDWSQSGIWLYDLVEQPLNLGQNP